MIVYAVYSLRYDLVSWTPQSLCYWPPGSLGWPEQSLTTTFQHSVINSFYQSDFVCFLIKWILNYLKLVFSFINLFNPPVRVGGNAQRTFVFAKGTKLFSQYNIHDFCYTNPTNTYNKVILAPNNLSPNFMIEKKVSYRSHGGYISSPCTKTNMIQQVD